MARNQRSAYDGNQGTAAVIDLDAFHGNVRQFCEAAPEQRLMAVIKTNGYGHGIVRIGEEALTAGAERLGISSLEEGIILRDQGIRAPVQLLRPVTEKEADSVVAYDLIPAVDSGSAARALSDAAVFQDKIVHVHLKLDTGLHRFGIVPEEASAFLKEYHALPNMEWEGIYTHFSEADDASWELTVKQFETFRRTVDDLEEEGYHFPVHHVGASTIALERPDMYLDMLRPGVALFGCTPEERQEGILDLKPVMRFRTEIVTLRELPPGERIGYGGTYETQDASRIAVLPVGLGDGYSRLLSNKGKVLIRGRRADVVGTIALDQTFIDVTSIPDATVGDEVVLIGEQDGAVITARDVADWSGTIVDEVFARIPERVERIYEKKTMQNKGDV